MPGRAIVAPPIANLLNASFELLLTFTILVRSVVAIAYVTATAIM